MCVNTKHVTNVGSCKVTRKLRSCERTHLVSYMKMARQQTKKIYVYGLALQEEKKL